MNLFIFVLIYYNFTTFYSLLGDLLFVYSKRETHFSSYWIYTGKNLVTNCDSQFKVLEKFPVLGDFYIFVYSLNFIILDARHDLVLILIEICNSCHLHWQKI